MLTKSLQNLRVFEEFEESLKQPGFNIVGFILENCDHNEPAIVLELISAATRYRAEKGVLTSADEFVDHVRSIPSSTIHSTINDSIATFAKVHCPIGNLASRLPATVGDYRFFKELGRDYSGVVYEALQVSTSQRLAVKVFFAFSDELEDKIQILSQLNHPGVPNTFENGTIGSNNFIAREIVEGPVLRSFCRCPPGLTVEQTVSTIAKILEIVGECHSRGLIHWNLSPDTMLLRDGEPVIVDFGLDGAPNWVEEPSPYRAPELLSSPNNLSPIQCDLFSVGVVLYELLTGLPPNKLGKDERSVNRTSKYQMELDDELHSICMRAISQSPASRFPSAIGFKETLDAWLKRNRLPVEKIVTSLLTDNFEVGVNETKKPGVSVSLVLNFILLLALLVSWVAIGLLF